MNTRSVYLDVFSHIAVHYRLVIRLLNYLIRLRTARVSYYRRVVYKFKYLKSQRFGIRDYHFLLIV